MEINPGVAESPSRQIADQLRSAIRAGTYPPGERLPSIPSLAEGYGVARQTVQRAIDQLRVEGLVLTRPGSGTFVRGSRRQMHRLSRARYGRARGYHRDMPVRYRQHVISVGRQGAPEDVAHAFGVEAGTELVVRRHVLHLGDQPAEVGTTWLLPTEVAGSGLETLDTVRGPLYLAVEEATGRRYARARDHITARQPTRQEAELLRVRPDTPVLVLLHVASDQKGDPIEVTQATWPGPGTMLVDEYPVPQGPERPDPREDDGGFDIVLA
ncbi:GntR family transcriptional regulator [Actinocatenispora rupis]|uniref:GntR family transcriptional regulator n=1 Tax=Actinocatenispora rupis TaxID=519421 RepID=A0A8J3J2V6_9ACTN|nr:GntR family transcriptional regulator [Actinocatenispora rupis]GID11095.1 GntR family transcriptional regulator [Actinocatenispora rupis]